MKSLFLRIFLSLWLAQALFIILAILVTLVLWLPDIYIWHQGQPAKAVLVLMAMHLAIALVTYNLLVHLAPVRASRAVASARTGPGTETR